MNEHVRTTARTTQAAEGLPRMRWTLAQFDQLIEAGILTEQDHVELIGGEIVPMSPKGNRHELVRDELGDRLAQHLPKDVKVSTELGWRPADDSYFEPDLLIYARGQKGPTLPAPQVLVPIEIADSSLSFDRETKSKIYAGLGVRDYWVVEAWSLTTHVHRGLAAGGYGEVRVVAPTEKIEPRLVPGFSVTMVELDLG